MFGPPKKSWLRPARDKSMEFMGGMTASTLELILDI